MNKQGRIRQEQAAAKAAAEAAKTWRQLRWLIAATVLASGGLALYIIGVLPLRSKLTGSDLTVLQQYEVMRHALANEELDAARAAADSLAAIPDAKPAFIEPARELARSDSLATARSNFVPLSKAAVALGGGRAGYFVMHCAITGCAEPCTNCPMDRFGSWLQTSREVENPYMGLAHLKCGVIAPNQSAFGR